LIGENGMENETHRKAVEALRQVHELFTENDIELLLDAGTLLGAVRNNRIIPWDDDFDITAWQKDTEKIMECCELLREKGLFVDYRVFENEYLEFTHISINFDKKRSFPIDLRLFRFEGEFIVKKNLGHSGKNYRILTTFRRFNKYLLYMLSQPEYIGDNPPFVPNLLHRAGAKLIKILPESIAKRVSDAYSRFIIKLGYSKSEKKIPAKYFRELATLTYYGMEFKVPSDTEKYLEYRYGEDWRIPDKNW